MPPLQPLPLNPINVRRVAQALREGGIAGVPTETVYGLAGRADDPEALRSIFQAKRRPLSNPLIVHVGESLSSLTALEEFGLITLRGIGVSVREQTIRLLRRFWPGPLTLIHPRGARVLDLVTGTQPSVGLRMPDHPVLQEILTQIPFPLAAPSANRFGRISPTNAQAVIDEFGESVPYVLDGGECSCGIESTIVGWEHPHDSEPRWIIYRPGAVSAQDLTEVLEVPVTHLSAPSGEQTPLRTPGSQLSHYAPSRPFLRLHEAATDTELTQSLAPYLRQGKLVYLSLQGLPGILTHEERWQRRLSTISGTYERHFLSPRGNWAEAAQELFRLLRRLDRPDVGCLVMGEYIDAQTDGLARAVGERLRRASIQLS